MRHRLLNTLCGAALGVAGTLRTSSGEPAAFPEPPSAKPVLEAIDKSQYSLFHPTPRGQLREMEALYESPYTVDAGHVQVETYPFGYHWDHDDQHGADQVLEAWTFAPTTLKLGLLNNVDAELALAPYTVERLDDRITSTTHTHRGFGDLIPRVRVNLWGNDGGQTAFALTPFVKIPTSQDSLGNGAMEGGLICSWAAQLPLSWWLILTPEIDVSADLNSSGYHPEIANTLYLWHSIVGKLSGYAEFFSRVSSEASSPWIGSVDFGLTFMLTSNIQLDAGTRVGVTPAAEDINPFVGISVRF